MMNCTEFEKIIDDYRDGELDVKQQADFDAHHTFCVKCQAYIAAEDLMLESLKAMPIIGPSEGFADRILHNAVDSNVAHHEHRGFLVGFGSAAMMAMVLWMVMVWLPGDITEPDQIAVAPLHVLQQQMPELQQQIPEQQPKQYVVASIPELSITLSEERNVKLAFYSAKALQGARIVIRIPDNVALVGYSGQRELSWQANLIEGDNFLRLPLKAIQLMDGQLVARIEHGAKVKTLRVNLKVGSEKLSGQGMPIEQVV